MSNKNEFHDEEYQFPQDGYSDDLHAESEAVLADVAEKPVLADLIEQPAVSGMGAVWANHKRTITIVGAVVVVAIVFSIMRATHKPAEVAPAAPAPTPVPTVVQQPVVDPQLVGQLTNLKQDTMNNSSAVRELQGQVQQLTNALNQARVQQQQANQNVLVLAGQVQQLIGQVKVLAQPKPVKIEKAVPKAAPVPVITYQLRAVVPGRAWIVASDGQSQSVAVGDHVEQYGAVQSIDADAGVVITTSGKTIKF